MGENCKYNGLNNETKWVTDFVAEKNIIAICPEELGGLGTPRPPAEQIGDRVVNKEGKDVTEMFLNGALQGCELALEVAKLTGEPIEGAILKANSPSCGCQFIYDGTFTGTRIPGDGYFTKELKKAGIPVYTELDQEAVENMEPKEKSND